MIVQYLFHILLANVLLLFPLQISELILYHAHDRLDLSLLNLEITVIALPSTHTSLLAKGVHND